MSTRTAVGDQSCDYSDLHSGPHSPLTGSGRHGEWMGAPRPTVPPSPAASHAPAEGDARLAHASGSEFPPSAPPSWLRSSPPAPSPVSAGMLLLPFLPSETDSGSPGPKEGVGVKTHRSELMRAAGICAPE